MTIIPNSQLCALHDAYDKHTPAFSLDLGTAWVFRQPGDRLLTWCCGCGGHFWESSSTGAPIGLHTNPSYDWVKAVLGVWQQYNLHEPYAKQWLGVLSFDRYWPNTFQRVLRELRPHA